MSWLHFQWKFPLFTLCDIFASTAVSKCRSLSTCLFPDKKTNQKTQYGWRKFISWFQNKGEAVKYSKFSLFSNTVTNAEIL